MSRRNYGDADILPEVDALLATLEKNIEDTTSFADYKQEVMSGRLDWCVLCFSSLCFALEVLRCCSGPRVHVLWGYDGPSGDAEYLLPACSFVYYSAPFPHNLYYSAPYVVSRTPVHKSEKFWKENIKEFEKDDYKILRCASGWVINVQTQGATKKGDSCFCTRWAQSTAGTRLAASRASSWNCLTTSSFLMFF